MGRLRDEHLTAVTGCCDPRGPMNVQADVALLGHHRLAGVHSHPNPQRQLRQRVLCGRGRGDGVRGAREGEEERVPLCVDLDAGAFPERLAEHSPVLGQHVRRRRRPSSVSSRVDPSMSVKRNVTVPVGSSRIAAPSYEDGTSSASRSSTVSRRRITRASPSETSTAAGRGTAL